MAKSFKFNELSVRDVDMMELVREGYTNVEIARTLNLSKYTVAKLIEHLRTRKGARNRTHLVVILIRNREISLEVTL